MSTMQGPPEPTAPGIELRGYSVGAKIHESTKTVLYRAHRIDDDTPVVVKILKAEYPSPRDLDNLQREYAILRELDVPGVVKVHDLVRSGNGWALLLDPIEGEALGARIGLKELDLPAILRIAVALADILGQLHAQRIIHKDIKPNNVIFDQRSGQVHLIDFGIATRLSEEVQTVKSPEMLEGTLPYMSPEQTGRMNRVIDHRTDFYSFGVTLYELLTEVLPFTAAEPIEMVHCHIARAPIPPHEQAPGVPEMVSRIVMKLLAKTAEDRYQSASGLAADLRACLAELTQKGAIEPFPIGQKDVEATLRIPQKLYGRSTEEQILVSAFERAAVGAAELFLVSGYAGIGKSALVHEIHKAIARRGGYFVEGKFDQLNRSVPYASVAQAFRELMRQILGERQERLSRFRAELERALAPSAQVLADLIPELSLIVGQQPPAPALGPTESQNRFTLLFKNFVHVFARAEHPLVLFLDDLHWADPASLKLLSVLLAAPEFGHLLVIGAYRDNEVDRAHPLRLAIDELRKVGAQVNEVTLEPLAPRDVVSLLSDTLRKPPPEVELLATVLLQRTQNNPFFLKQFLGMLYAEGLLRFDAEEGAFTWDLDRIRACPVTDNVVDFMAGKIQRLAPALQELLKLAACIGHAFDLNTLSIIAERSPSDTAAVLWGALEERLILPVDASYRFLHDRVQQAAYSLIEDDHKKAVHLQVGRLMLAGRRGDALGEAIFDITNHLNIGAALIEGREERLSVAELNLNAGRRAKTATAYRAAADYFRSGMELLPEAAFTEAYKLSLALYQERAEAEYLSGNFEEAEALYPVAIAHARTALEKVSVLFIQATQYQLQGRQGRAIQIHRQSLALLGWTVPEDQASVLAMLDAELREVSVALGGRQIEDLVHAPKMTDKGAMAMLAILQLLLYAAYVNSDQTLANLSLVKMTTLSLQLGNSEHSSFGYVGYGMVAGALLGDHKTGHRFGRMAIDLCEQFDNIDVQCKTNFLFAADLNSWSRHIKSSDPHYDRAYELGVESGDWVTAGYAIIQSGSDRLTRGMALSDLDAITLAHLTFLRRAKNHDAADLLHAGVIQPIRNFLGLTDSPFTFDGQGFREAAYEAKYASSPYHLAWLYYAKIRSAYLFDDRKSLPHIADKLSIIETFVPTHAKVPETCFYVALIRLAAASSASGDERRALLSEALRLKRKLLSWAEDCEENIRHKVLLVEAEEARVLGRRAEAMDLYDRAIESARENEYINNEALANELYGRFWVDQGRAEIGRIYLRKALYLYERWGALAKVNDIERRYGDSLSTAEPRAQRGGTLSLSEIATTTGAMGGLLDLSTVLRAGQAISSEMVLDKVIAQLLRIVTSSAGANRGFLLLFRGDTLVVEATISTEPDVVEVGLGTPVEELRSIPRAVVEYVTRAREPVVVGDAVRDARFAADPAIAALRPRSILCLPLLHQGRLRGLLYLENTLAADAFNVDRIGLLQHLSSQAAIAVENALLYSHVQQVSADLKRANELLEQQVSKRTSDLLDTNERLVHELAERERTEEARVRLRDEVIALQQKQLEVLSTPVIPITDQIIVMPLIGAMDTPRANALLEAALHGAQRSRAKAVIIDVTGMTQFDKGAASALIRAANALRLLGAEAVLTGVRPEMAQALIAHEVDLSRIVVRGTLQSGIAYALGRAF